MATHIAVSLPKPWPDFLKQVDVELSQTVHVHCLGGFVLASIYSIPRYTGDLDYTEVIPREAANELERIGGRDSALCRKFKLYLQSVGVADLPEEYESRLQPLGLNLAKLKLWALDAYDLLLSKLPRNSPKDRDDAKYLIAKLKLDFETFVRRWEREMAPSISNRDRHELTMQLWKEYF